MGEFQDNGIGWQIFKANQRFWEWLERVLTSDRPASSEAPDWVWSEILSQIVIRFFQGVTLILLVWILWQLALILWPQLRRFQFRGMRSSRSSSASFSSHSLQDWWQMAQVAREQGDHAEACRCLYLALLRHLHDHQILPELPSRTDGEYIRGLLAQQIQPLSPYELLIRTHETLCFDRSVDLSTTTVDRCFQALAQITQPSTPVGS